MPIDVLGDGVDHNIRTVIERVLDVRAEERVVHHDQNAMSVRDRGHLANVDQAQGRVRRTLDPDQLRVVRTDELLDVDLNGRREGNVHAVGGRDLGEIPVCAAVDIRHGDDVRSGREGLQDGRCRCGPGREGEGVFRMFQRGDGLFEVISGESQRREGPDTWKDITTYRFGFALRVYS